MGCVCASPGVQIVNQLKRKNVKKPIETAFKEIPRRLETTPELLIDKDRRWDVSAKQAEVVALLVQEFGNRVNDVAEYLRRDQANISTMLSWWSSRERRKQIVMLVMGDPISSYQSK